jgi:Spy/CpxP family protein refolding chaperone
MKKLILVIGLLLMFAQFGFGQHGREQMQSARIAFITERLDLTPETAQKFWPVYNQINQEKQALRKEEFSLRRSASVAELTEADAKKLLADMYAIKERQLKLEMEAADKYQQVLSAVQVVQLVKTEEDFRRMVINQLRERRGSRGEHREERN